MAWFLQKTTINDLFTALEIYSNARDFMKRNGNPDQWGNDWPSKEKIEEDIKRGISYKITDGERILAVFAFRIGEDKTYLNISEGHWLSNKEYGTIHRFASSFIQKGVFKYAQNELEKLFPVNFRIDTHKNNLPMRRIIEATGYVYCGIIEPIEGGERLAYEKIRE